MLYEDIRAVHEDLERLEDAIAERILDDDPKHIRNRLVRDHEISNFLERIQAQSQRGLQYYNDEKDARMQEIQQLSTGDTYSSFYAELESIKDFHKRNPNEPTDNTERAYKKPEHGGLTESFAGDIDAMFTGEEAHGRFFDLTLLHEEYLNLPGVKGNRKLNYVQYLDVFDFFTPPSCNISRKDKMTDEYFAYVRSLAQYLESFIRKIKPLDDLTKMFKEYDDEFEAKWSENSLEGWRLGAERTNGTAKAASNGPKTEGTGSGIWCPDCEKEFSNDNVYKSHLTGKKHIKNAATRKQQSSGDVEMTDASTQPPTASPSLTRLKERVVAEREHRIRKLAAAMSTERSDTRTNVERKAGMTDRERQQELASLHAQETATANPASDDEDDDGEEKVYNPLKLPLAWDGKPIPFWLYKLHGLGVEFPCEICGNFVYMGRRAFDKHFSEAKHLHGLKSMGITRQTSLFREITKQADAEKLWKQIQRKYKEELALAGGLDGVDIEEVETSTGIVMSKGDYEVLKQYDPRAV